MAENEVDKNTAENESRLGGVLLTETARNFSEKTIYIGTAMYLLLNVYMLIDNLLFGGSVFLDKSHYTCYRVLNMVSIFLVYNGISMSCFRHESSYYMKVRKYALSMLVITFLSLAYFLLIDLDNTDYPLAFKIFSITVVAVLYGYIAKESRKDGNIGLMWFAGLEMVGFVFFDIANLLYFVESFFIILYKTFTIIGMVMASIYCYQGKLFK